jgi:hypothetical protein
MTYTDAAAIAAAWRQTRAVSYRRQTRAETSMIVLLSEHVGTATIVIEPPAMSPSGISSRLPGSSWNFDGDPTGIVMVRR